MQRVHTAHLVLMRVSHHRQRDRQVDLLLDPVEDLGGLVIGPGGIDHQHAAAIPDDQTVGSDCPETRHVRDRKCAARHSVRAGGKPDRQTVGRQFHCWPIVGRISPGMHPLSINAALMRSQLRDRVHNIGQFGDICHPFLTRSFRFELPLKDIFCSESHISPGKTGISSGAGDFRPAVASVFALFCH